jgi:hypothetical protein
MDIIIFSTNEFDIYQDKNKNTLFTIISKNYNDLSLFRSIVNSKIANNSTIYYDEAKKNTQLKMKALSIQTFEQFKEKQTKINGINKLSHNIIQSIIYSLTKQIFHLLNNESKCFYKLDTSNILVIDDCKFMYLSQEHLKEVKDCKIHIYNPISKNVGFLSPELLIEKSIPIFINYKTFFYSLGLLILDNMRNNVEITINKEINISDISDELFCIKDTKLCYFLERCLQIKPCKRFLLYV